MKVRRVGGCVSYVSTFVDLHAITTTTAKYKKEIIQLFML
jgi:hypothetical protein